MSSNNSNFLYIYLGCVFISYMRKKKFMLFSLIIKKKESLGLSFFTKERIKFKIIFLMIKGEKKIYDCLSYLINYFFTDGE